MEIIATGIDWRRRTFRDANGDSRVLRIWDQVLTPVKGKAAPARHLVRPTGLSASLTVVSGSLSRKQASEKRCNPCVGGQ